jgi:hypothetical protein
VANKCDLPDRPIPKEEIQALCDEQGYIGWIETSAKEDVNVSKAMRYLIEHILYLHEEEIEVDEPKDSHMNQTVRIEDQPCVPMVVSWTHFLPRLLGGILAQSCNYKESVQTKVRQFVESAYVPTFLIRSAVDLAWC